MNSLHAWTMGDNRQLKAVEPAQLPMVLKANQFLWVHIVADTPKKYCKQIPGLPLHVANSLGEGESRPSSEILETGVLMNVRCINPASKSPEDELVSLRLWVTEHLLVTVQRRPFPLTEAAIAKVSSEIPASPIDFLSLFLAHLTGEITELLFKLEDQVDALEERLTSDYSLAARVQLNQLRRHIVMLRRYLVPQREALVRLHFDKFSWVNELVQSQCREYTENTIRIVEDLDELRERTTLIQEMLSHATQEQMNRKIYMLSIVAVIFMPLSFVTGLLGINVGGIPGASAHIGFTVVCGVLAVLATIELWILRRRKWL